MAQETPSRTLDKVIVRLPDGMRDRIAEAAKANNRSMNAEIVARLEMTFAIDDRRADSEAQMMLQREAMLDNRIAAIEEVIDTLQALLAADPKEARMQAAREELMVLRSARHRAAVERHARERVVAGASTGHEAPSDDSRKSKPRRGKKTP